MPQITLSQDTAGIQNHGEYDIGVVATDETKSVVFTIGNSGDAALSFISVKNNRINLTDNTAGLFTVSRQPAAGTNVTPGGATTFTVLFSPASADNFSVTVNIKTNNKTEDEFTFAIYRSAITNIVYSWEKPGKPFNIDPTHEQELKVELPGVTLSASTNIAGNIITAEHIQDHNTFEDAHRVALKPFAGASLVGSALRVVLPAKSVVTLELG
jgi:hypothetical protein